MQATKPQSKRARTIRAELAARGLTQTDLSREWGIHINTINGAINHGLNKPTLLRILNRLRLSKDLAA